MEPPYFVFPPDDLPVTVRGGKIRQDGPVKDAGPRNKKTQMVEAEKASTTPVRPKLTRRQFVVAAAAVGTTAVLGDVLLTYPPWLDYAAQERRTWNTPFQKSAALPIQIREIIRYATLAPSGHNTQPWKFAVSGNTIRLLPDYSRRLPAVDPQDREFWISLGCALENMTLAVQSAGYGMEITYPAPGEDSIAVRLTPSLNAAATLPLHSSLFEAIPHRQNNRSLYDGRSILLPDLKRIAAVHSSADVSTLVLTDTVHKEAVIEYVRAGDKIQFGTPAFVAELVSWMRFNQPEALHSLDGLYTRAGGNPDVPRWLGREFLTSASAGQQSDTDAKKARSSSGLIVVASASDDKRHWIETGRFYERLALTLTIAGIQTAFLNQPAEVPALRSQLQSYLGLGTALPQLLLRFGYAPALPRSLRRPVEQVLVT